jgi:hypothetical protein
MPHNEPRVTTSLGLTYNHVTSSFFYPVGSLLCFIIKHGQRTLSTV